MMYAFKLSDPQASLESDGDGVVVKSKWTVNSVEIAQ